MSKIGHVLGLVSSLIIIFSALMMGAITFIGFSLSGIFDPENTQPILGLPLYAVSDAITFALGIVAAIFSRKAKRGLKKGYYLMLIIGVIGAIGVYIPLFPAMTYDMGGGTTYPAPAVPLIISIVYIEYFLLINGGIIGLLSEKLEYTPYAEDYALNIEQ